MDVNPQDGKKGKNMARLVDVAKAAGVSRGTASKCVQQPRSVKLLTDSETLFPTTNLRLIFRQVGSKVLRVLEVCQNAIGHSEFVPKRAESNVF